MGQSQAAGNERKGAAGCTATLRGDRRAHVCDDDQ